ncbi:OmpA family protein [Chitinophaga sp. HK235]|uniref:OmpA family protein n=1 Tax=Chitinophaga sp. HK235 TaxID=2952571 RepID=UPI001BA79E47|nr:OmpA family protein [Chitinophaga sp. HK235]
MKLTGQSKFVPYLLLLMAGAGFSRQAKAQYAYREALNAYQLYNFEKAKPLFEKAFRKKPSAKAAQGAADSYRLTKDYQQAEIWYAHLWETQGYTPADELHYAAILMNNGKYEAAASHLQHYLQADPNNKLALHMQEGCRMAATWLGQPVKGTLENMQALNSPYSDWSITRYHNKYIFASDRPVREVLKSAFFENENIKKKMYTWTGNSYLHLYESNGDSTDIKPLEKKTINGAYHSSNASYNGNGNTMYLAVTTLKKRPGSALGKDSILTMNISVKEITLNDQQQWVVSPELPFNATLQYSVGDPWINPAGDTLYFVSNTGPGQQGGTDIYYAVKTGNSWSSPVNMGPQINTPGNERTPAFDAAGSLYFASDGHPGLGGLDIFKATQQAGGWNIIQLGVPVNSRHDDFAPALLDSTLYFASNRDGGKGSDDIYRFIKATPPAPKPVPAPQFSISGIVTDRTANMPLIAVTVTLTHKVTGVIVQTSTNDDGQYQFPADSGGVYELSYVKSKYTAITHDTLSLKGYTTSVNIKRDKQMEQTPLHVPFKLDNIYFDLGKSDIRPDAARELDKLVTLLQENPTWEIELGAHTDSRANDAFNLALSQRRAAATVAYLVKKGINAQRLTAKGYGETKLVNRCANGIKCTEAEHLANRRTEFIILKL